MDRRRRGETGVSTVARCSPVGVTRPFLARAADPCHGASAKCRVGHRKPDAGSYVPWDFSEPGRRDVVAVTLRVGGGMGGKPGERTFWVMDVLCVLLSGE